MPEENVEIVRRVVDAFLAGIQREDFGAAWDTGLMTADAEWVTAVDGPTPTSYRGQEGFAEFMRTWIEDFEGWSIRVERLVDAGNDRVVGILNQKATGMGSGIPVELQIGTVYELESGRLARVRTYLDPDEALRAAGLSE